MSPITSQASNANVESADSGPATALDGRLLGFTGALV
jgi:hypothetical protein